MLLKMNPLHVLTTAMIVSISITSARAAENEPSNQFLPTDQIERSWTPIRTEVGVAISYSTITLEGENFLCIQFENTTTNDLDLIWSLTKNATQLRITEDEMAESRIHIPAQTGVIFEGVYLIPFESADQFSDFTITLQATKN